MADVTRVHTKNVICPAPREFPSVLGVESSSLKGSKERRGSSSNFFGPQHLSDTYGRASEKEENGCKPSAEPEWRMITECVTVCKAVWPHNRNETHTRSAPGNGRGCRMKFKGPKGRRPRGVRRDNLLICRRSSEGDRSKCANFQRQIRDVLKLCQPSIVVISSARSHAQNAHK